ncbi:MAG: CocE/NonD family hydrolase [Thermoplasmatota archaeon]
MRFWLLLLLVPLAGCVDGGDPVPDPEPEPVRVPISEATMAIGSHEEAHFEGTTGVQLYLDWVLPEGEGPFPTILGFTPYQGMDPVSVGSGEGEVAVTGTGAGDPYSQGLVDWFVPRGYAVAFADVRGNHEAGGCIDQTGPEQWQDGYDYVQWIADQPWSNGNVGMWGASYVGETQFTTAMLNPPALKTIVPVASVSNQYEWSFFQGVPYELQPLIGMASYFQGSAVPSSDPNNAPLYAEKLDCQAEQFQAGLDFSGDHTEFWRTRDYRPMAADITASVLHVHGLRDWNVRPIHIDPIFNDLQSEKRGIFGQWGHAFPDREDWALEIQTAWYDHFLKGWHNGILEILPPVLIEDDTEQWWGIDSFPPRDQPWQVLQLSATGELVASGAQAADLEIVDYPEEVLLDLGVVPDEQQVIGGQDLAPDRLEWSFTTDEELRLVGRPWLQFNATTDEASTHWVAHLTVDGKDCGGQSVCDNHGYQDTRHRNGFDAPSDVDGRYSLRIDFYPQYDVIPAGSTVRLTLSNNDGEIQQDPTFARSLVHVGPEATLHLPLAPTQVALPHDTLPDVFPGYVES